LLARCFFVFSFRGIFSMAHSAMKGSSLIFGGLGIALVLVSGTFSGWAQLPEEPMHETGQGITGAFEGWFQNHDGSYTFWFGYNNRNTKEELDIPIGPNNRIEPGGPDQGQPTHFLLQRQMGLFSIKVPKDFGSKKLTWTLVANGKTAVIPASLNPLWEIDPFSEAGAGKTPPLLWLDQGSDTAKGPYILTKSITTAAGTSVPLTVWVSDEAKNIAGRPPMPVPVTIAWSKYRGPGNVIFGRARPPIEKGQDGSGGTSASFSGKATTTATFSEPGEYVLEVVANGTRGFRCCCCWTESEVKVVVTSSSAAKQ
jgi:hypothetical protein